MIFTVPKDMRLISSATYQWDPKVGTTIIFGPGQTYSVCSILAMQFIYEGYRYMKESAFLYDNMMSLMKDNWIQGDLILTVFLLIFSNLDSRTILVFSYCSTRSSSEVLPVS